MTSSQSHRALRHFNRIGDTTLTVSVAEIAMPSPSDQRRGSCAGIASACALRTKALDIECDADVARMFERERHRHAFALPQWGIQIHEHQMRAAGRETDGLAGFDQEAAVDRAHLHHSVID